MNTDLTRCSLRKREIWVREINVQLLKLIGYFPDYLSAFSHTLLRFFWTTFVETAVCFVRKFWLLKENHKSIASLLLSFFSVHCTRSGEKTDCWSLQTTDGCTDKGMATFVAFSLPWKSFTPPSFSFKIKVFFSSLSRTKPKLSPWPIISFKSKLLHWVFSIECRK